MHYHKPNINGIWFDRKLAAEQGLSLDILVNDVDHAVANQCHGLDQYR